MIWNGTVTSQIFLDFTALLKIRATTDLGPQGPPTFLQVHAVGAMTNEIEVKTEISKLKLILKCQCNCFSINLLFKSCKTTKTHQDKSLCRATDPTSDIAASSISLQPRGSRPAALTHVVKLHLATTIRTKRSSLQLKMRPIDSSNSTKNYQIHACRQNGRTISSESKYGAPGGAQACDGVPILPYTCHQRRSTSC